MSYEKEVELSIDYGRARGMQRTGTKQATADAPERAVI